MNNVFHHSFFLFCFGKHMEKQLKESFMWLFDGVRTWARDPNLQPAHKGVTIKSRRCASYRAIIAVDLGPLVKTRRDAKKVKQLLKNDPLTLRFYSGASVIATKEGLWRLHVIAKRRNH